MRRLLPLLLVPVAYAAPASAAPTCSEVRTTGTVLGEQQVARRCTNNPLPRSICTDTSPGVAEAGISARICHGAP